MSIFTGTNSAETIVPGFVSPTVVVSGSPASPSNASDTINAGGGIDTIDAGGGNDFVTGGQGNDAAFLGAGNDAFFWRAGDGNDAVEGGIDFDTLELINSGADESISISANGGRVRLLPDVAGVSLDLNDVERLLINPVGGSDTITVNSLAGTDVTQVVIGLAGVAGGLSGDGVGDRVEVNGTGGNDQVSLGFFSGAVAVNGLSAQVIVDQRDANDNLTINGRDGHDTLDASAVTADDDLSLVLNGGSGNDTVIGSGGDDVLVGGSGNDIVSGNGGDNLATLGIGDDVFVWNPGEGFGSVFGESGFDRLEFNGSNAADDIDISLSFGLARVAREDDGSVELRSGVEAIDLDTGAGNDDVRIGNLAGTEVATITASLGSGNDFLDANGSTVTVLAFGQDDGDFLKGGGGADTLDGGSGNDLLIGRAGDDTFVGGLGDDGINGGAGTDTAVFTGNRANYQINLLADGRVDVVDRRSGQPFGTDSLFDVERLVFVDGSFAPVAPLGDVVWRHGEGSVATANGHLGVVSTNFQIRGSGDFDGDGDGDILWRHNDGLVVTWEMEARDLLATHNFGSVATTFQIAGTGDFDGDGDADIVWRHQEGHVVTWEMEDGDLAATRSLPQVATSFQIAGTGDFDGDGDSDILWRGRDGEVVTWDMQDGNLLATHSLPQVSTSFQIAGTGDFDGDGDADIVWRGSEGAVVTWEMEDGAFVTNHNLPQVSTSFQVVGAEDFDSDGDADILWRGSDGFVVSWEMDDGNFVRNHNFGVVATAWDVRATGEFDLA